MGTDDFPDGITVQMMFTGRKRYGSFNQYLNALYTSNKKGDLVTALKMLSEKTNSIVTALSKLVPGLKIAIHHTQEAFVKQSLMLHRKQIGSLWQVFIVARQIPFTLIL